LIEVVLKLVLALKGEKDKKRIGVRPKVQWLIIMWTNKSTPKQKKMHPSLVIGTNNKGVCLILGQFCDVAKSDNHP